LAAHHWSFHSHTFTHNSLSAYSLCYLLLIPHSFPVPSLHPGSFIVLVPPPLHPTLFGSAIPGRPTTAYPSSHLPTHTITVLSHRPFLSCLLILIHPHPSPLHPPTPLIPSNPPFLACPLATAAHSSADPHPLLWIPDDGYDVNMWGGLRQWHSSVFPT
jgi:hypothetical protein